MLSDKIVFDTNTIIGFLQQHEGYPDLHILFPDADLFISEITEFELLSFWNITPAEEAMVSRLLEDLVIVPFLPKIKRQAVLFRKSARTKTPDSIIAATTIVLGAALVTFTTNCERWCFPALPLWLADRCAAYPG